MAIHFAFDLLAALSGMALMAFVYRWRIAGSAYDPGARISPKYIAALVVGAVVGSFGFGTMNLWLSAVPEVGRSVLGALAGAIAAIEFHKARSGIRRSTGLIFVAPFATSIAVGRIGCLLSGLEDQTYGIPTHADWGWDFGDGIARHPVPLYESAAMVLFLLLVLWALALRHRFIMASGFYVLVIWYGTQRFVWEFFKPYETVVGPFNLFHLLCAALVLYGTWMIARGTERGRAPA